jgi:hypothetical protein
MDQKQFRDAALTRQWNLKWWQHVHVRFRGQKPPPEVAYCTVREGGSPPRIFAMTPLVTIFWTQNRNGVSRFAHWSPLWRKPIIKVHGAIGCNIDVCMHDASQ